MDKNSTISTLKDRFDPMEYVKVDPPGWQERKNMAAKVAAQSIIPKIPKKESDPYASTSDSEASSNSGIEYSTEYSAGAITKFADALRFNFILDPSFHDSGILSNNKFCFCPCSKKGHKWREIFEVTGLDDSDQCDSCSKTKPMSPNAFMDHLVKVGENRKASLHQLVDKYLRALWGDCWGKGIGHKALYKPGDAMHKKSERVQMKIHQA